MMIILAHTGYNVVVVVVVVVSKLLAVVRPPTRDLV